jgi:hypothetical protein
MTFEEEKKIDEILFISKHLQKLFEDCAENNTEIIDGPYYIAHYYTAILSFILADHNLNKSFQEFLNGSNQEKNSDINYLALIFEVGYSFKVREYFEKELSNIPLIKSQNYLLLKKHQDNSKVSDIVTTLNFQLLTLLGSTNILGQNVNYIGKDGFKTLKVASSLVNHNNEKVKFKTDKFFNNSFPLYMQKTLLSICDNTNDYNNVDKGILLLGNHGDSIVAPLKEKFKKGCYIATACYGDYNCSSVLTLRNYRDRTLSKYLIGRTFIRCYYILSPKLSQKLLNYRKLNHLIKVLILNPIVEILKLSGY